MKKQEDKPHNPFWSLEDIEEVIQTVKDRIEKGESFQGSTKL